MLRRYFCFFPFVSLFRSEKVQAEKPPVGAKFSISHLARSEREVRLVMALWRAMNGLLELHKDDRFRCTCKKGRRGEVYLTLKRIK